MTVSHALFIYFERAIMIFVNNFGKFEKKILEKKALLKSNWKLERASTRIKKGTHQNLAKLENILVYILIL